jgi:hypothetical protein
MARDVSNGVRSPYFAFDGRRFGLRRRQGK